VLLKELEKDELIQIIEKLKKENKTLKEQLYGKIKKEETEQKQKNISSEEKVRIFMEIFKGRTDLYAKRWTSNKTGKSGYSPVCKNEFSTYKCDKPRVKCSECPYRELLPLTEDVVLKHLKGDITIGIYPLLPGDLCNFLAIDFDKKTYEKDVIAFWNTCDELGIPIYVERSRSGNGAHIWIFFEENMPAIIARKMGNILLTKTMEKASLDLDSYDRLFPNQDTMPKGGFGNLIALPFQGESSKSGNTVFVDKYFEVQEEQLNILTNVISFEKVLKSIRSKYVYGLTATPTRKDGWHKIIYMQCGDIRVRVSNKELKQNKEMEHTVIVKKTNYKYIPIEEKDKIQIAEILNDMSHNVFRNSLIIEDIRKCITESRTPIVLTERVEHLDILKEQLEKLDVPVVVYKGNMGKKKTKEIQEVIKKADENNQPRIILATSSSIGEGFDDSRLDTLFLTMPVSWKGRIIQYVGRLHREHEDKEKVIVYDYLDNMKVLEKMYTRRIKGYKMAGYELIELN